MRQVNSRDFKAQLDEFLELAKDEPILVAKAGKPVAILISIDEFQHLQRTEDAYWTRRAHEAEQTGE